MLLNRVLLFLFTACYLTLGNAQEESSSSETLPEVEVIVGLEKIIKLDFVPNSIVKIANENLVSYQIVPQKREILLTGMKAGDRQQQEACSPLSVFKSTIKTMCLAYADCELLC